MKLVGICRLKIVGLLLALIVLVYSFSNKLEGFESQPAPLSDVKESDTAVLSPNGPSPANIENRQPYHLLSDIMAHSREKESVYSVNSRSCYATDFERTMEKTGNFRQMTNNYKRNYPDSCSGWNQDLTLNFYQEK
jgi:hypothetical protein